MAIASLKEVQSRTGRLNGLGDCRQEIYSVGICHLAQLTFGIEMNLFYLHLCI